MKIKEVLQIIGLLIGGGAFIGFTTNLINSLVSPLYFKNIMGWDYLIQLQSMIQGIFEGMFYGLIFSIVLISVFSFLSNTTSIYIYVKSKLPLIGKVVYGSWIAGGLLAFFLAYINPILYQKVIIGVPNDTWEMMKYAWVEEVLFREQLLEVD